MKPIIIIKSRIWPFEVVSLSPQVAITANNVRRLQLFDDDQSDCMLLALHPPNDPTQGVEDPPLAPTDTLKTDPNSVCSVFQCWLCTCRTSGGVWTTR